MRLMRLRESLPPGIEAYRLDIDLAGESFDVWPALTDAERARAGKFARAADRIRFAATRGATRWLLGRRVGCRPAEVRLSLGANGKPFVDHIENPPLFNISHSGHHALIAIADAQEVCEIGVDIEQCQEGIDTEAVLELAFTDRECSEVRSADDRVQALYRRWVGKEAVLKAVGVGIPEHLRCIGVHPGPGAGLSIECGVSGWKSFEAMALSAPAGYAAALAWRARAQA